MATNELAAYSATQLTNLIRNHHLSREELLKQLLTTIDQQNPHLNAVTHLWRQRALKMVSEFKDTGQPFAGIPILLKGLGQSFKGEIDSASSHLLQNYVAPATNNFVKGLLSAGLIPIGETNAPEFGFKNITDSKLYGNAIILGISIINRAAHPVVQQRLLAPGGCQLRLEMMVAAQFESQLLFPVQSV